MFETRHANHGDFVKELEDPLFGLPIVDLTQFAGFLRDTH
jgi:hypothetical protein